MTEPTPPNDAPLEGEVIAGKYRVQRVLGRGGMGVVISARHLFLNQDVAIKLLFPGDAGTPAYVARFFREAQAAAAMKDEHIVRVVDMGLLDSGAPYMVMEYLEGLDLGTLVDERGPIPVEDAIDYTLQTCQALAEAHAGGLVHRDIKPSNLFLVRGADGSGLIKLLDFGIAKTTSAVDGALTVTGAVMGSPNYMSPEQIRSAKIVDGRSDIWSLGATLHELLTGTPPFIAPTFSALCAAIIADAPVRLCSVRPELPAGLEAVILRCLEKDPERRFPDVAALAQELAPFAPPSAQLAAERVAKMLAPRRGSAHSIADNDGAVSRVAKVAVVATPSAMGSGSPFAQTTAATAASLAAPASPTATLSARRRIGLLVGAALVLAALAIALSTRRAEHAPAPLQAASPDPSLSPAPVAPPPPLVTSTVELGDLSPEPLAASSAPPAPGSAPRPALGAGTGSSRPRPAPSAPLPLHPGGPRRHVDPFADQQ